jgi:hypothetical protein
MRTAVLAALLTAALVIPAAAQPMTPAQYHKEKGPCACPDDKDKSGHRCGKRSAFCRSGGAEVKCFLVNIGPRTKAACG